MSGEHASYTSVKVFYPSLSLSGKGTNCGFLISNQSTSSMLSLCVLPNYLKKKKPKIMQWTFLSPAEMNSLGRGWEFFLSSYLTQNLQDTEAELTLASGTRHRSPPKTFLPSMSCSRFSVETGKGINGPSAMCPKNVAWGCGGDLWDRIL